ncbi:IclR family transcriptional regulator [Amycolatopsis sp. H20-H5]|uniref:IclR family transcriptional regulator n=1 Tax=Amycolatopsis sp. H20-H5 TaxID=3046309 RepID=UPI002DBD12B0|nr:IclR family transcriptional regulator [Amycolatopsis sp. H20-H5]MEC3974476.1 IclR family transcriptional regulator [Amycolatopsis sp. H20-H5]
MVSSRSGAAGVLRGLEILESLAGLEQPATLTRIASRSGLNEAATYRALRRLEAEGYVDHAPRVGYRLGSRSIALAVLVGPDPPLLRATHPVVTRLVTTTGHSAAMHLRSGGHRVLTVGIPSPSHPLRDQVVLGERAPLTSGSSGLAILAHLPPEEAQTVLSTRPAAERRPSDQELERIRRDGYSVSRSQNHAFMTGISAPLLDPDSGTALGSLSIASRSDQAGATELADLAPILLSACAELGPRLAALIGPGAARSRRGLDVVVRRRD